jgi:hypothetical protein
MDLPWKDEAHTMEDPKHDNHLCVAQGTLVLTARGQIPVESVTTDDFAWTRAGWKRVLHVWSNGPKPTMQVECSNGSKLICTHNHPIFSKDANKFVRADALSCGSKVEYSENKTCAVEVVAVSEQSIENVWNLEVDDAHEYYANGILVHNCDATTYAWRECTSYLYDRREPDAPRLAHTSTKWDDYGDNDVTTSEWGDWGA